MIYIGLIFTSLMNKAIYMKRQAYTYYYIKYPHSMKVH